MASTSSFRVEMAGFDPPPSTSAYGGGLTCSNRTIKSNLANGNGDNELDTVLCVKQTLAAGASFDLDFLTDLDRYGVALGATDVVAGVVENQGDGAGVAGGTLAVQPGPANGWTSLIAADPGGTDTPRVVLPPFSGFAFWGFTAGTFAVGAANQVLRFIEIGAVNPVAVETQLWLRQ